MFDRDIRNFFKSDGNKSSTNKSNLIKQITLDPKKDIKKITKKPKAEKKPKKAKIKITEEQKEKEKKEFSTPVKKKLKEINKDNIVKNKPKINLSKNKKIILDDEEDESENMEVIKEEEEAGKISDNDTIKEKKIEKERENYNLPPPVKKEEKLVPVSVSDFFSNKKITLKSDIQLKEEKEKENRIEENKMEIEEEKGKKENKEEEKNNNIDLDKEIVEDIIMENENNKNKEEKGKDIKIKIEEKVTKKNINLNNKEEKEPFKKEKIQRPIIRREIKKEIKTNSENLNIKNKEINNAKINPSLNNSNNNQLPVSELWADKYMPKVIADIVGNQQQLKNLENWLDNWDDCILKDNKKEEKKTGKKTSRYENVNARAAIISGPPGIGKTSSVRVLTKNKGYRAFELNASDKRNKDTINNSVGFLMNNTTLSLNDISTNTKNIIIMDEVDGMAGNEDKGGIKALIDIVKKTKVPIIFICNDIYSPKLKSLLNYCYDIRFNRPDKRQIVFRLLDICKKEGVFVDNQTLTYIVENFGNDIRQTINYLDLCSRTKRNVNDIKKNCEEFKKDKSITVGSFDISKILLNRNETSKLNFSQKLDLFFVDFDLIPNMIFENYISTAIINNNNPDKRESLKKITEGTDFMSFGDVIENRMKSQMEWSLLPDKGVHSTVIPSMIFSSFLSFPKFPEHFNKITKIIKLERELKELKKIFHDYSLFEIKNFAGPLLFNIIIDKLVNEGKDGIDNIVDILVHYRMNSNLFKENLFNLQTKENQTIYSKINTSIKTSLTKKLNEKFRTSLKPQKTRTLLMPQVKVDKEGNIIDDYNSDDVDEEEADDSSSFFEPIKKTNKKKNK